MANRIEERRKYLRLNIPIEVEYLLSNSDKRYKATTTDISALGVRFTTTEDLQANSNLEITLKLPNTPNPVHASGRVAWVKKNEVENKTLSDVGIEFLKIEEDNKNTFLKYLCDLIYG